MKTLYIYHNVITFDEERLNEYIETELSKYIKYASQERIEYEWSDVEQIENCTLEQLMEYLTGEPNDEIYKMLELGKWNIWDWRD